MGGWSVRKRKVRKESNVKILFLLSQRLVKVVTTLLFELSFKLVRLAARYLSQSQNLTKSIVLTIITM